jgi:biotin carboxylase
VINGDGALIVLGAGEEQVAIFQEARRRGLPTIGVDMRADRPGIALADEFLLISTTDHAGIADALAGRHIAGVVSTAADTCLASWHRLSEHFRTPWRYPAGAATVSMDKAEFHRVAASVGVPAYRWIQSDNLAEVAATVRSFRFPVVVKPADASGGRGVHRADTLAELDGAIAYAARHSPRGQVIAEEVLTGRDFTVNVFMVAGDIALSLITEKQVLPGPGFLIGGHRAPAELDEVTTRGLLADAHRLCLAFGLTDGPANFDVILAPDGTRYVLEVGARMSGNGFPRLVHTVTGVDWMSALVDLATGRPVTPLSGPRRPARLHVLTSPVRDGVAELVAVEGIDRVAALPGVETVEIFVRPGDPIRPFTEAGRKLGWIVVSAERPELLDAVLDRAISELGIVVGPLTEVSVPATT